MSLVGTLSTMPITDVLQWLAAASKTGTLQVERNRIAKWIMLRNGRVVGCSSDDPPQRLGQYLLSRELITEERLVQALATQNETGQHLGRILVETGVITQEALASHLESKAEETIYSLFDWEDGVFRFKESVEHRPNIFPVDIQVQDVLLRGLKRYDDMKRIRELFSDPGLVLGYTSTPPGPEIFGNKMARTMYSTIDGDRSIAEILLQVHGSEYEVYRFLFDLHQKGYVEFTGRKTVPPAAAPRADVAGPSAAQRSAAARPSVAAASPTGARTAVAVAPAPPPVHEAEGLQARLASARRLMAESKFEQALDILDAMYRQYPGDDALRRLTAEAEAAFVDRTYRHFLPPHKIPVLTRPAESLAAEALSPHEFFLLSRIDGSWDLKSIIQVAPLREVDALRTLKRMREMGMLELREPV